MADMRLIDANEAYEAVTDLSGQADTKSAYAAFWKAGKVIRNLPTVGAAPVVHGRWCFMGLWEECSVCKHPISVDGERTNFCPNCGAKMDGKDYE